VILSGTTDPAVAETRPAVTADAALTLFAERSHHGRPPMYAQAFGLKATAWYQEPGARIRRICVRSRTRLAQQEAARNRQGGALAPWFGGVTNDR
jgi:hypothetical protein